MKHCLHIKFLSVLAIATCLLTISCDKVDDNGDLGGLWQLTEWKSLPDGEIKATKKQGIYYAVQLDLLKLNASGNGTFYLTRFKHTRDSLIIGTIYKRPDENIVPYTELARFGVPDDGGFAIERLTSHTLILRSKEARLTFRKY